MRAAPARTATKPAMSAGIARIARKALMSTALIEALGFCAATLTTLCWLPQAWHTIRTRDTSGISLWTQALFATGIVLWLIYGMLIGSWPLIGANIVTLALVLVILTMKVRYG